jgi:hypothetical protein
MFSEIQLRLLDKAERLGYGYFIFASNVRKQGWCSPKQEEALINMISHAEYRKTNRRNYDTPESGITHEEIMSFGLEL